MGGVVGEPFGAEAWCGWGVARGGRHGFAFHSVKSGPFAFFSHVGPSFPAFNPTAALGRWAMGQRLDAALREGVQVIRWPP
jgi:hypothetical protein